MPHFWLVGQYHPIPFTLLQGFYCSFKTMLSLSLFISKALLLTSIARSIVVSRRTGIYLNASCWTLRQPPRSGSACRGPRRARKSCPTPPWYVVDCPGPPWWGYYTEGRLGTSWWAPRCWVAAPPLGRRLPRRSPPPLPPPPSSCSSPCCKPTPCAGWTWRCRPARRTSGRLRRWGCPGRCPPRPLKHDIHSVSSRYYRVQVHWEGW